MAIQQTQDWRIREAINKKIARQIEQGLTPLTRYKTYFPYTEGGDLIDRRTGKVKSVQAYVDAAVREDLGTQKAFVQRYVAQGMSATAAKKLYATHKAERVPGAKSAYSMKLHILAGMDITSTKEAREYNYARADAVVKLYMERLAKKLGGTTGPQYAEAVEKLLAKSPTEQIEIIRVGKRRSCPDGRTQTLSFYEMIGEYLGIEYPSEPPTP